MAPRTRYARNGDVSIAYQVVGDGPIDLVHAPGSFSHLEYAWEEPGYARWILSFQSLSQSRSLSACPPGIACAYAA